MPVTKRFDPDVALEKAMLAFWTRGYAATSLQDLVNAMGVNRASLYATFGDKRTLFRSALLHYDQSRRVARLRMLEAKNPSPVGVIRDLFEGWVQHSLNRPEATDGEPRGCLMTNTALELSAHDSEIGALVSQSQHEIEVFLQRTIERAKSRAEIPSDVCARKAASALLASLLGMLVLARSRPDPELLGTIAEQAVSSLQGDSSRVSPHG